MILKSWEINMFNYVYEEEKKEKRKLEKERAFRRRLLSAVKNVILYFTFRFRINS